jgi:putative hemolysin
MKSGYMVILVFGLCVVAGIVIAGCTQPSSPDTTSTTLAAASTTQPAMANPASVNCGNIGGTTQIMTNPDGSQYGMCTFSNGTSCEEWALFRGEGCQPGLSLNQTGNSSASGQAGMANPASVNCVNVGGTLEIKNSPAGQYGMCTFANGSSCEEWALFRGEGCKAVNVSV